MSLLARLVARLGIDCGLPAAGVQRAWLAADALADREAEEECSEPAYSPAVCPKSGVECRCDRTGEGCWAYQLGRVEAQKSLEALRAKFAAKAVPAGVERPPGAPPAGLNNECRHCSLPSWVVHCPNGVTQAMCQHHGFISTERK